MYPTIDKIKTGERLRNLIKRKGLTVKNIQKYLGLSCVQSVYHWLDGTTLPTIDNLYALSDLLGVSIDYMLIGNKKTMMTVTESRIERMKIYYTAISRHLAA